MINVNDRTVRPRRAYMNIVTWMVIAGAVAAFVLVKRASLVGTDPARAWLKKGAIVIDVRSAGEFQERHLPAAINIPLDQLAEEIARRAPDKAQPLRLHCLSGTRSGTGTGLLKKMGYQNVFNLGSYGRAETILGAPAEVR